MFANLLLKFSHAMEKLFSVIIHACDIHFPNGPMSLYHQATTASIILTIFYGYTSRPACVYIMLQNLPIMLFSISQVFCLLCSFLCFPNMHELAMLIIFANYVENWSRKAIHFNAATQPDYLALPPSTTHVINLVMF